MHYKRCVFRGKLTDSHFSHGDDLRKKMSRTFRTTVYKNLKETWCWEKTLYIQSSSELQGDPAITTRPISNLQLPFSGHITPALCSHDSSPYSHTSVITYTSWTKYNTFSTPLLNLGYIYYRVWPTAPQHKYTFRKKHILNIDKRIQGGILVGWLVNFVCSFDCLLDWLIDWVVVFPWWKLTLKPLSAKSLSSRGDTSFSPLL